MTFPFFFGSTTTTLKLKHNNDKQNLRLLHWLQFSALIWSPVSIELHPGGVLKDQGTNDFGLGMCLNLGGSFWSQDCYLVFWVQNVHVCLQLRLKTKIIKTEVSEGRRLRSELKQTFSIKGKRKNNLGDGSSSPRLATIPSTLAFQTSSRSKTAMLLSLSDFCCERFWSLSLLECCCTISGFFLINSVESM